MLGRPTMFSYSITLLRYLHCSTVPLSPMHNCSTLSHAPLSLCPNFSAAPLFYSSHFFRYPTAPFTQRPAAPLFQCLTPPRCYSVPPAIRPIVALSHSPLVLPHVSHLPWCIINPLSHCITYCPTASLSLLSTCPTLTYRPIVFLPTAPLFLIPIGRQFAVPLLFVPLSPHSSAPLSQHLCNFAPVLQSHCPTNCQTAPLG